MEQENAATTFATTVKATPRSVANSVGVLVKSLAASVMARDTSNAIIVAVRALRYGDARSV